MKKYCNNSGTTNLIICDKIVILDFNELGVSGSIAFDRYLLDMYAEDYIKANFEMSDDGWIRRIENDETV
ncbi:hypothetical protein [Enterococcus cecorum]|uniref:hypothetical protein n=1 Tax=Enterococcus cecorum TaxID=44008 RepID=UPI000B20C510|nr:hypothetical protein [Enterococcus cecorum]CAI3346382.1 hypothetical protein CIRMBP1308_00401 [Enterococcus cecorum]